MFVKHDSYTLNVTLTYMKTCKACKYFVLKPDFMNYDHRIIEHVYSKYCFTKNPACLIMLRGPDLGSSGPLSRLFCFFLEQRGRGWWRAPSSSPFCSYFIRGRVPSARARARASFLFAWHNLKFMSSRIGYARPPLARLTFTIYHPHPLPPRCHPRRTQPERFARQNLNIKIRLALMPVPLCIRLEYRYAVNFSRKRFHKLPIHIARSLHDLICTRFDSWRTSADSFGNTRVRELWTFEYWNYAGLSRMNR